MFGRTSKKSFFLPPLDHITNQSTSSRSSAGYIMMHDINIEEETKCKTLDLALLLLSSVPMDVQRL